MQDVSCEPLMLCPSENPQASLDIFSQPHHHPTGSLHPSQGDKQGKTFLVHWILFYHGLDATCTPVPGGHYRIVTGGNALGIDSIPQMLPGGQYAAGFFTTD